MNRPLAALALASLSSCASSRPVPPPQTPVAVAPTPPAPDAGAPAAVAPSPLTPAPVACVSDEPTLPDTTATPLLPASAPPAATALCARAAAANAARLGRRTDVTHVAASLWCVPTTAGAWMTVLDRVGETHENGVDGPSGHLLLRWAPLRGAAVTLTPAIAINDAGPYWGELHAAAVTDWDGDGLPEVVLATTDHMTEEDHHVSLSVHTARGGRVARYGAAPEHPLSVADFDGDGRIDAEVGPGFSAENTCGLNGVLHWGPRRFVRSRPDGTFTENDPAARAYVRRQCAFDPAAPLLTADEPASALRVACARWFGVGAEAVAARVRQEYPGRNAGLAEGDRSDDGCFTLETLLAEAATEAPFTLAPRCR
jgi:hypothetical protein